MLLPDNIHPENSLYFNGAIVLSTVQENNGISMLDVYEKSKEKQEMTFSIFVLCLDWLYLLDVAELSNGKIYLCS